MLLKTTHGSIPCDEMVERLLAQNNPSLSLNTCGVSIFFATDIYIQTDITRTCSLCESSCVVLNVLPLRVLALLSTPVNYFNEIRGCGLIESQQFREITTGSVATYRPTIYACQIWVTPITFECWCLQVFVFFAQGEED